MKQLSKNFEENKKLLDEVLEVKESFDLIYRVMEVGGRKACFYFILPYFILILAHIAQHAGSLFPDQESNVFPL